MTPYFRTARWRQIRLLAPSGRLRVQERRYGPRPPNVGFSLKADALPRCGELAVWANTGLPQRSKTGLLFDDIVRDGEHAWRNGETEHFGGLEVDDQLDLGRLHDG
jgi:hypothetical protein